MTVFFDLGNGVCWTLVYLVSIIHGIKHRTWCIPKLAICMSFSWELLVVVHRIRIGATQGIPFYIQLTWLILDIAILIIWLIFDNGKTNILKNLILLLAVFFVMYAYAYRSAMWEIAAFLDNAIMSALFIYRKTKDDGPWTSRTIAVAKTIGTLSATFLEGVIFANSLILWIGGLCFLMDLYYVSALFTKDSF